MRYLNILIIKIIFHLNKSKFFVNCYIILLYLSLLKKIIYLNIKYKIFKFVHIKADKDFHYIFHLYCIVSHKNH